MPSYVEIYNETAEDDAASVWRHADLTYEVGQILRGWHPRYKIAALAFSGTKPSRDVWGALMMWRAPDGRPWGGMDAIAIHEYWADDGFTADNGLHHRQLHEWANGNHPPFIITECGRQWMVGGTPIVPVAQYAMELTRYDQELQQDSYVIGGTVFTAGGALMGWGDWDTDYTDGTDAHDLMVQLGIRAAQPSPDCVPEWTYDGEEVRGGQTCTRLLNSCTGEARYVNCGGASCDEASSWGRYQDPVCQGEQQCYSEINACTGATRLVDCRVVSGRCGGGGGGNGGGGGGGETPTPKGEIVVGVGALLLALLLAPAGK